MAKWGVGKKVDVKMLDGDSLNGRIRLIAEDGFVLTNEKQGGREASVSYAAIKSLKAPHSLAYKIGLPVAIAGVVVIAVLACIHSPSCYYS